MTTPSPPTLTIYLLPWLAHRDKIDFGCVSVAGTLWLAFDQGTPAGLDELTAVYVNQAGYPCETSVMWFQNQDVVGNVTDSDVSLLRAHAQVLGAAAIAENKYFDNSVSPMTAAHFDAYFHRYQPGMTHMSLQRRRRDGPRGNWPLTKVHFTVPAGAAIQGDLVINQPLLDALAAGIGSPDPLDERIQRSIGHFLDGNRLDDISEIHRDLIWLGAALENLLDISGPGIAKKLGQNLTALFDGYTLTPTSWNDHKGQQQNGPWLARWAEEFYDHRSAIHGRPARTSVWQPWEHGLIATVVWGLSVKLLLVDAGRYSLTDNDRTQIQALDERIATGSPVQARWGDALLHARRTLGP